MVVQRKEETLIVCMNGEGTSQNSTVNTHGTHQSIERATRENKEEPPAVKCFGEQVVRPTSPCRNRSSSPLPSTSELSPHKVNCVDFWNQIRCKV